MPIRVRYKNGKTQELPPDVTFVEVCDLDGKVGAVLFSDYAGCVRVVTNGGDDMERYKSLFNVGSVPIIGLDEKFINKN